LFYIRAEFERRASGNSPSRVKGWQPKADGVVS
jgi:hypothetical protein